MDSGYNLPTSTPTMIQGAAALPDRFRAPGVVRFTRAFVILNLVVLILLTIGILISPGSAPHLRSVSASVMSTAGSYALMLVLNAGNFALDLWILRAINARITAVWYVELACQVVGVLSILLVFVMHSSVIFIAAQAAIFGVLLYFWLKPETKRYFNVR